MNAQIPFTPLALAVVPFSSRVLTCLAFRFREALSRTYIIKFMILSHAMFCVIRNETKECQVIDVFMQKGRIAKLKSR